MIYVDKLNNFFQSVFGQIPLLVKSPGRINLIGEHTDYNDGFVLPAAIDKAIYVAVSKREDNKIHLHALEYNEECIVDLENLRSTEKKWSAYILGVVEQLQKRNYPVTGFNIVVDGDVPVGAGMSSSAAVECATAFALNELFDFGISKFDMVKIAQKAEHEFVGLQCGIMDMFASMFGKKDHVIRLDCRSLEYDYVPLHFDGIKIVLLDTNIKHSLASSEYNTRRQQCEAGVRMIQKYHPEVKTLRDATIEMLDKYVNADPVVYKRCKFIVEENARLLSACDDLKHNNIHAFGQKMFDTHYGLSKEYEVSCEELDLLVEFVKDNASVFGARMMGGGFGGCTINLVKEDAIEELIFKTSNQYKQKTGKNLNAYVATIENGTRLIGKYAKV